MPPSPSRLALQAAAAVVVGAVALSGCTSKTDTPSTALPASPPTVSAPASTTVPSPTPTVVTPTPSPTPTTYATLANRLLGASQVPALNSLWHWGNNETVQPGPNPVGLCAKADLASIGSSDGSYRTFTAPSGHQGAASEQIAEFPDTATAARAAAVLNSWHQTCSARLDKKLKAKVGPVVPVQVGGGGAFWYLVRIGQNGQYSAFGYAVVGARIAVVTIDNFGQDYTYPATATDPSAMSLMVQAAAARLG
ncbi:MAG TPA: hypothetical protein VFE15_09645 [Marmoricola sp.]|jgi:hypothetical protein|nr:hypothetical protein [Marmoricola sp.]